MTTKRLAILLAVVGLGLSTVFLLPKSAAQPAGLKLTAQEQVSIPEEVAGWLGRDGEITENERKTLGEKDDGTGTKLGRKFYSHPEARNYEVLVSVVLSGHDMSTSIHRPERCLDAQGWSVLESEGVAVHIEGSGTFPTTRLHNRRTIQLKDGKTARQDAFTFYWFVGENEITASHWGRFFQDNRDRLLRGVNQRWAFITVTAVIPTREKPEEQAEAKRWVDMTARKFIKEFAPLLHKDTLHYQ